MNSILTFFYRKTPSMVLQRFGRSDKIKGFRNWLLRGKNSFRETVVTISRKYGDYQVSFLFFASIKVAAKAKERGIETKLLNNSIKVLKDRNELKEDITVFDIGANFGYLSLVWAKTIAKRGKVFSFEPNPKVFNSFLKSVESNGLNSRIQVENLAVGNENGMVNLFLNESSSNTVIEDNMIKNSEIEIVSLDEYIKRNQLNRCDLIKVDVDGIEFKILQGAIKTINKFKPILIVETNNDKRILEFVEKLEYSIFDMDLKPYVEKNSLPHNVICKPKN